MSCALRTRRIKTRRLIAWFKGDVDYAVNDNNVNVSGDASARLFMASFAISISHLASFRFGG